MFQEFELLEYLDVLDNILLPYRINAALALTSGVRERARGLADKVGIGDKLRRNVAHLSQGERQRAAICRALLPQPALLLCDEPTGNLDPANTNHVTDILFGYIRSTGATMMSVTHEHQLLERFARVIDFSSLLGVPEDLAE